MTGHRQGRHWTSWTADGWAVESTTTRLEAARRGDPRSQEDLIALAANLIHRDSHRCPERHDCD
jgi:hypothetical protein